MSQSAMASRDSRRPPTSQSVAPSSSQRRPGGHPVTCNRCRKPLATTVFVCACDCVFCEECTYNHFNSSSNCPTCNRTLSESDFMELVIADPSNTNGTKSSNFQTLFTKQNKTAQSLAFQDLCSRVLKHYDDLRSGTKFLMKQFLMESSKQGQRSMQAIKSMENLKRENTSLKQLLNSERVKTEQTIESYQQQLTAAQRKIEGKEQQLMKFRSLHQTMTPESPRGRNNEARRVSGEGMGVPQPPIKGFMIQKEAHERAKQRAMEPPQRAPVLGGHPHSHSGRQAQSYISQVNTMPQQRHSSSQQRHPSSSRSHGSGGGSSVGIRDFTSSTQYAFSSGGNKRRRTPQERVQQARAMSPSQAFAAQPPGSYSTARGPASYFQQGYGRR